MRKTWFWILAIFAVAAIAGAAWWLDGPITVSVVAPTRGPAVDAIYATGTVEPTVMLPIAPRVAGRVVALNYDEGSEVRKGQVLARLDDADLASTVDELEARARYAKSQHERAENMVRQNFMAQAEADRTRADLEAALAALKRARSQRDFMVLTTPADGLIIRRDGEVGQYIPAGQPVFYLSCCAPLRVTAEVDEEDIARVHVGQKVLMHADALPGKQLEGTVSEITPKGDPVARSYRVRVKLAEPNGVKVGMTADANLIVAERQNALLVPSTAVHDGALWLVNEGRLHRHLVRIGVSGAGHTEVIEGLAPDALVVDSPGPELREGRTVRLRPAAEAGRK